MDTRRQSGLWEQNAEGHFERKAPVGPFHYYQPPASTSAPDRRRSYSERAAELDSPAAEVVNDPVRAATQDGLVRSTSVRKNDNLPNSKQKKLSNIQTIGIGAPAAPNTSSAPANERSKVTMYQPESPQSHVTDESIPANLRTKTWSPQPDSPTSPSAAAVPQRHASATSEAARRSSVPDRSPLQNLEVKLGDISKEEKRARVQEAERKAARTAGGEQLARSETIRSEKPRVLSDGSRRANDSARREDRRHFSAGALPPEQGDAIGRSLRTNDTLRQRGDEVPNQGSEQFASGTAPTSGVNRMSSQKYRHRARDAGFAGAAAAVAGADDAAAARGKAAYERRKSQIADANQPVATTNISGNTTKLPRTESNRLPKTSRTVSGGVSDQPSVDSSTIKRDTPVIKGDGKHELHENRLGTGMSNSKDIQPLEPDPLPKEAVRTNERQAVPYMIPPQTAAARQAKERVTFAPEVEENDPAIVGDKQHHGLKNIFGHHTGARGYQPTAKPLEEWRNAETAHLSAADLVLDDTSAGADRGSAWWENSPSAQPHAAVQSAQRYEERAVSFDPPLFLKCGPLLRFTGIRKPKGGVSGSHTWRGSILIVTEDEHSDLARPPTLRLFAQDSLLYRSTDHTEHDSDDEDDPITGLMKTSRTGRPIYVRSLHDIEHGIDLSRTENNRGLFSANQPSARHVPKTEGSQAAKMSTRILARDGEKSGVYREIKAHRLQIEQGCTFWRFNIEIELGPKQSRVAYRVNNGPAIGFWVPARGQTMNIMFHSCNGFSLSVDPNAFCGPDPLWRDVLNRHQSKPFHVMIGGGDQIYNDAAIRDTTLFKQWLQIKNPAHKHHADFTVEMQEELESFFFNRYAMWFSQGLFGMANAQIPMVNIWDDHDIIDGFGSYPHHFMSSPVFTGLGAVAFKYYMLFQQQSLPTETTKQEPSWLLGASPGPYINELNRSIFVWLGDKVALLALDCRTERMRDEILSQESYDIIFDRCRAELVRGHTKHLVVLLGVPIAYPRLNFLENILTSRLMDPIKAIGRTGMLGGFVNKFDGGVEILDDLDDHWTAKHHKQERNWFIEELQELAADRSVRITILGGDVHLGAVGQFYSNKNLGIAKDRDHRYMPNVISSAIVNTPPPPVMADVLNKRNKVHHLDHETDEDMIPMFDHDVDSTKRNNKRLLPRRNFAVIREYMPGSTPPSTPPPMERSSFNTLNGVADGEAENQTRPGVRRSLSLTRGPSKLIRRLSLRGRNPPVSLESAAQQRRPFSFQDNESVSRNGNAAAEGQRPSLSFHRRPTSLSVKEARKAAAKGGPSAEEGEDYVQPGDINLQGGLDISLCMEVDQHDPAGRTVPYRLLVPALWYEGHGDVNTLSLPTRQKQSVLQRFTSLRKPRAQSPVEDHEYDDEEQEQEQEQNGRYSDEESQLEGPPLPTGAELGTSNVSGHAPANTHIEPQAARIGGQDGLDGVRATAASSSNATGYGTNGPSRQPHPAYQKGFDLGSPPLGKQNAQAQQSSHAHAAGYFDDRATEESLTASEVVTQDSEPVSPQQYDDRGASKAERFFGIGSTEGNVLRKKSQNANKTPRWKQLFKGGARKDDQMD